MMAAAWWHDSLVFVPAKHLKFNIYPQREMPLWELWDLATYAEGPRRCLTFLCIR